MTNVILKGRVLLAVMVAVAVLSLGLAGCNTTAGFGQDVKAAGSALEGKAKQEKEY